MTLEKKEAWLRSLFEDHAEEPKLTDLRWAVEVIDALKADNARLRAVVKTGEHKGRSESSAKFDDEDFCPWCHYQFNRSGPEYKKKHGADCEAFFEDGGLR